MIGGIVMDKWLRACSEVKFVELLAWKTRDAITPMKLGKERRDGKRFTVCQALSNGVYSTGTDYDVVLLPCSQSNIFKKWPWPRHRQCPHHVTSRQFPATSKFAYTSASWLARLSFEHRLDTISEYLRYSSTPTESSDHPLLDLDSTPTPRNRYSTSPIWSPWPRSSLEHL